MTREALAQAISDAEPVQPPSPRAVIATTAQAFGLSVPDMLSPSRAHRLVQARQVAIALVYATTTLSLPEVGLEFERDHSTVLYAVKRVQGDPQLRSWAAAIRQTIKEADGA